MKNFIAEQIKMKERAVKVDQCKDVCILEAQRLLNALNMACISDIRSKLQPGSFYQDRVALRKALKALDKALN